MIERDDYLGRVNDALKEFVPTGNDPVSLAMNYSVENGGKRIRPMLVLEFCRVCGKDNEAALPFACALEMIHTYSLIHDDLPCMDDDDMRRGKPSCHVKFGEAYALLAGDALLTLAFETVMKADLSEKQKNDACLYLAKCAGINGMVGGQTLDLMNEGKSVTADELKKTDSLKTLALINAACILGCIAAGADDKMKDAAEKYANGLGLAFQIVDDILDVTGDSAVLGKPVGSDETNDKSTYVSLLGIEESKRTAEKLTNDAKDALNVFGKNGEWLKNLADKLLNREN